VREITVDGTSRTYRVRTPPGEGAAPVLVALHDAGNDPEGIVEVTQLDRAATQHGFAVVFPAAVERSERTWNAGFCCGAAPSVGVDDVAFLGSVLDELAADERLDADRVHLAGVSNGAVMAYHYACAHADRVVGVASVAGTMDLDGCEPSEPVSVLEIHGTADGIVPFDGGEMPDFVQATQPAAGAESLVERWAELNGCADEPATTTDAPVTRTSWEQCDGGATVELIAIEGAGHTWYASEFGETEGAVDATAEIVRFFGLHR
jgi:polyhydroxybutyrate depolymerase